MYTCIEISHHAQQMYINQGELRNKCDDTKPQIFGVGCSTFSADECFNSSENLLCLIICDGSQRCWSLGILHRNSDLVGLEKLHKFILS